MSEDHKTARWIVAAITIVTLVGIGVGFATCDRNDERRLECVKRTNDAAGCKLLFPEANGR
jgi:hypothetical protein